MANEDYRARIINAIDRFHQKTDIEKARDELVQNMKRENKRAARREAGKTSEHEEQAMLCNLLDSKRIEHFAVPNGVVFGMDRVQISKYRAYLRSEGLRCGAPDLILVNLSPTTGKPVCIEMKSKEGRLSDIQATYHEIMRSKGWHVIVAYGCDDAMSQLEKLGFFNAQF